jgi:hypothetical protein
MKLIRLSSHAKLAITAAFLASGCGKAPPPILPAAGIVLLEGRPLNNVEVRFIPTIDNGTSYIAKGVTDQQGRFTLTCNSQPGACAGENRVVVREAELPKHLKSEDAQAELAKYLQTLAGRPLPERYTNLVDNPLSVEVTAEQQEYKIELQR